MNKQTFAVPRWLRAAAFLLVASPCVAMQTQAQTHAQAQAQAPERNSDRNAARWVSTDRNAQR